MPLPTAPLRRHGAPLLNRAVSGDRRVWFRLVTRDVDRHGTIIEPAGIDTTAFLANPVFLWMHDSGGSDRPTPPPDVVIGRVVNIDQTRDHFDIEVEFDDDGDGGLATTCYRKVKAGFIRMVSIGCNATSESVAEVNGVNVPVFPTVELLEASLVIIGSNRSALKLDRAAAAAMLRGLAEPDDITERDVVLPVVPTSQETPPSQETPLPPVSLTARPRLDDQVASVAVFDVDGKMLWGRRRDTGKWTTPGGHFEPGDDPLSAALRELREEAAIDALTLPSTPLTYLGPVNVRDEAAPLYVHCFRLDLAVSGEAILVSAAGDPDKEIAEWRWVDVGEVGDEATLPDDIASSLHAPRNAFIALGVIATRAVGGAGSDAGTAALLSDVVDDGDILAVLGDAAGRATPIEGGGSEDANIFPEDESTGIVVKTAASPTRTAARSFVAATRGVVAHKAYPTVMRPWDAADAVKRWRKYASSDGSSDKSTIDWAKYAQCFLWFDSSDRENFASYKFPHHDIVDGKPVTVWAGVVAAAARIDQAKGIPAADIAKMKAHLAAHYKEFDKVAPWQRRDIRAAATALFAPAFASLSPAARARAAVYAPLAVNVPGAAIADGPAHVPVDADGTPYLMAVLTPYALIFPASRFTVADAVVWAKDHGYSAFGVREVGDGISGRGLVVTENSVLIEQLPPSLYQAAPFGPGVKWQTVSYPGANGIACVYGVLRTKRLPAAYSRAIPAMYDDIDFKASAGTIAELKLGLDWNKQGFGGDGLEAVTVREARKIVDTGRWWPEKATRAYSFFARHDAQDGPMRDDKGKPTPKAVARALWGGDAGKRDVKRIRDAMVRADEKRAARDAWPTEPMARAELMRKCAYAHNTLHYLVQEHSRGSAAATTAPAAPTFKTRGATPMKRTPEARAVVRGLIHHAMEHADMHARALEDGHISDEHRAMCHAMAMRSLDHAAELHDMYRTVWLGDKPSQSVIVDAADVGMEYAAPAIADEALKARFATVAAKVGKLPVSLRSIVKRDLGVDDAEVVEEKLLNLKGIQERYAALQAEHRSGVVAAEKLATDKLIADAEEGRLVSPAEVKRMRGLDPATNAVVGQPWGKARVERFLEERRQSGPIADIARPRDVRTVDGAQGAQQDMTGAATGAAGTSARGTGLIRFGNAAAQQSSPAQVQALTQELARRTGVRPEQITGYYADAAALPNSEGSAVIARTLQSQTASIK